MALIMQAQLAKLHFRKSGLTLVVGQKWSDPGCRALIMQAQLAKLHFRKSGLTLVVGQKWSDPGVA
jgi:hypothetical protein